MRSRSPLAVLAIHVGMIGALLCAATLRAQSGGAYHPTSLTSASSQGATTAADASSNSSSNSAGAIPPAIPQITQAINPNQVVVLHGNVNPLARAEFDQGAVADAQPLHRMLMLLQRSAPQEAALQEFMGEQQDKSSASFHTWLTPAQFGAEYGPAAGDVQTITSWLAAQGFQINRVSAGRTVIEFDGTAGQVRSAFHTEMHRYLVNGVEHFANASDPQIPAALAPVVAGIVSLHNFPEQSHLRRMGAFERLKDSGEIRPIVTPLAAAQSAPLYTPPNDSEQYPLVPGDFGIIYNVAPLWSAGIDGTGQTIAIVGETDITVSDVQAFRALFGLANNFSSANVIVDGIDPGITGDETEADLDIEWSGAVAKNATITYVEAAATEVTGGVHLAALYAVDHDVAAVVSESYGNCEQSLGTANNAYYNTIWEQAAAEGITVLLSSGDGGAAGCDDFNTETMATQGIAVSGYASTPFDVAVGGTDFDQINKWPQFWSATNNPTSFASAMGYIPEIPWNNSCAQLGIGGCGSSETGGDLNNIVAGSGGPSTIYTKPSWQTGMGVPLDGKRDIPDVSLMASNGFTGTGYLICQADAGGDCVLNGSSFDYQEVGGTSASAPAFAGIVALVNHSQAKRNLGNRQGNANYVLYALAKQQQNTTPLLNCNAAMSPAAACTFNDVVSGDSYFPGSSVGTNSVPCAGASTDCSSKVANVVGILLAPGTTATPAWTANAGYDLVTGLGSVNAENLVNNWKSANSVPTTTTLSLNGGMQVNITHGASVSVNIGVSPTAASGQAALVAAKPGSGSLAVGQFTLAAGMATGTTDALPGGASYKVSAHYEGDGTNAPSDSTSVTVTVAPEPSKTFLTVPTFDPNTGRETSSAASTLVYGSSYLIHADVTNATGSTSQLCVSVNVLSCPTGNVTITDALNGGAAVPLDGGTFGLNSAGYTEDQNTTLLGGTHMLNAQYGGDNSYTSSASAAYPLTVTPAASTLVFNPNAGNATVGQPLVLGVQMFGPVVNGAAPTGTVAFYDGTTLLSGTATITSTPGTLYSGGSLTASLTPTLTTPGVHVITAKYTGDANYGPASATFTATAFYSTTITITSSTQNLIYGAQVTLTAVVDTNVKSPAPTGQITFFPSYDQPMNATMQSAGTDTNGNVQLTATVTFTPQTTEGVNARYAGDNNFNSATSGGTYLQVTTPDFSVATPAPIVIMAGQTGMATLNITPLSNLSSTVMLSCANTGGLPMGSTCSVNPAAVNLANSVAGTGTVMVTSIGPSPAAMVVGAQHKSFWFWLDTLRGIPRRTTPGALWPLGFAGVCVLLCWWLATSRKGRGYLLGVGLGAFLASVALVALGCGSGGSSYTPPPPQKATTITTVSTATPKVAAGSSNTFTVTVSSTNAVTGTVQLSVNGAQYGPYTLVGGAAPVQLNFGTLGATMITATYSGDANNLASTSTAFTEVATGTTSITVQAQTGSNMHPIPVSITIQ